MRIFLTGGTGFIGSHVADKLDDQGYEVVALVRESSDVEHLESLDVDTVVGSLGRAEALESVLEGIDAVIHIAGITGGGDPEWMYRINADGTRDLVDRVAERAGENTRFVYLSSVSAQGPASGPNPRPQDLPPKPVSHYGRSKLDGEGAVLAHRDRLNVTIIRPPVVYGPRDRDMLEAFSLANRRIAPVLGGRERCISVIHGEDVARAVLASLEAPGDGEVYTIDDGNCYTWRQLGDLMAHAVGKQAVTVPVPTWMMAGAATVAELGGQWLDVTATFNRDKYREMVQPSWVCGHDAICRDLGWEPKWTFRQGARQTVEWYRDKGWL